MICIGPRSSITSKHRSLLVLIESSAFGRREAKNLGQSRKVPLREDWEDVKVDVMRRAVTAKFTTHTDLQIALLSTGEQDLVENAPSDYFWGSGALGSGKNMLGQILMQTRQQLRDQTN